MTPYINKNVVFILVMSYVGRCWGFAKAVYMNAQIVPVHEHLHYRNVKYTLGLMIWFPDIHVS
jgi:hypothetical protein